MCGIIAYSGFRDIRKVLLEGLDTIQYRGYDSMGMVIAQGSNLIRIRSVGGIDSLKQKSQSALGDKTFFNSYGLGHSRWATHGRPIEKNAHPHKVDHIYIVHNGIIENGEELKAWLKGPFISETDSEVVAHCLVDSYAQTGDLKSAIFDVMKKIKGEYAVAVLSEKHPHEIAAFKKGPSLLVGVGKKEVFLSSDAQTLLPYIQNAVFLNDDEVVFIHKDKVNFYSKKGRAILKKTKTLKDSLNSTDKLNHPHYMLKEIHEQPDCVSQILNSHLKSKTELNYDSPLELVSDIILKNNRKLYIVACGSSYYSALYGKYVIEQLSGISVEVDIASEFRYRYPAIPFPAPILLISQSGETADTLATLKIAKKLCLPVISLCNTVQSSLDRRADKKLYMQVGVEKAVASTKSFTSSLVILLLLALFLSQKTGKLKTYEKKNILKDFFNLPNYMKEILSYEQSYISAVKLLQSLKSFIYLGRGIFYPLALEGSLKMKELVYVHAAAYPAGEMKHGPLALVDRHTAVVGINPPCTVYKKTLANLEEARAREGKLILVGAKGDTELSDLAEHFFSIPKMNEYIASIASVLPLQLMAYYLSCFLGHNVDQPRNLAKSVTVE